MSSADATSQAGGASAAEQELATAATSSIEAPGAAKDIFANAVLGTEADTVQQVDGPLVQCHECMQEVDKAACQQVGKRVGKQKGMFKCNACNALKSRMNRMFEKNGQLAKDWMRMLPDEKTDFMARSKHLQKEELLSGVQATVEMSKSISTSMEHQNMGEFLPVSVYRSKGYSDEHIAALEKSANNPVLNDWVYQLMIEGSGVKDKETVSNNSIFSPAVKRQPEETAGASSAKRCKVNEEKKAEEAAKKAADAAARKHELEQRTHRKNDLQMAKKIVALLAPVMVEGMQVCRQSKNSTISAKLPECMVQDANELFRKIETANLAWQDVIQGAEAPKTLTMQLEALTALKKDAAKAFSGMSVMIAIASR